MDDGINLPPFDEATALVCPECGGGYLHHTSVEVFSRSEDAKTGLSTTTTSGDELEAFESPVSYTGADLTGNPSARRGGITIRFRCETCDRTPSLYFAQHKGVTLIGWRPLDVR